MHLLQSRLTFRATSPTSISTLSLHDALPIFGDRQEFNYVTGLLGPFHIFRRDSRNALTTDIVGAHVRVEGQRGEDRGLCRGDRKSTRLNSSHVAISYAVFCLTKKTRRQVSLP